MQQHRTNPYINDTHVDLARACMRRAGELERGTVRTPAQRAALADDTRLLLIMVGNMLDPTGPSCPDTPEWTASRGETLAEAFMPYFDRQVATLRASIARRAAAIAYDNRPGVWIRSGGPERAAVSDEALSAELVKLQKQR